MQIRIKSHSFTIPARYAEGHRLTASEAAALNGLMAENVRNNVDQWVKGQELPEGLDNLQSRITRYAQNYQFSSRPRPRAQSPLEKMIAQVILENFGQVGEEEAVRLGRHEAIKALAHARLAQEDQVARDFLRSLWIDGPKAP